MQANITLEWEDLNTNTHKLLVNESLMEEEELATQGVQTKRPSLLEISERDDKKVSDLKLS